MNKDLPVITCPVCGKQHLFSEIYLPESFAGKAMDVIRTEDGKIDYYIGDDMDLDEEFICEDCFTKLKIHANLSFNVEPISKKDDFSEEYITKINKRPKIKLTEDNLFTK